MRKALGGALGLIWLVASIALWAGQLHLVPAPSASSAIGLSVGQAVLLSYHLTGVLETLAGAFSSLLLGGLFAGVFLLLDGLWRKARLAAALGGAIAVLELAMGLFTWLRAALLLPAGATAAGLLNAASIAGELAAEVIPAALLLALALGAILVAAPRARDVPLRPSQEVAGPPQRAQATGERPDEGSQAPGVEA